MTGPRTHATRSPRHGFLDLVTEILMTLDRGGGRVHKFKLLWDCRIGYASPYWDMVVSAGLVRLGQEPRPHARGLTRQVVFITEKGERILYHYRAILQELDGVAGGP